MTEKPGAPTFRDWWVFFTSLRTPRRIEDLFFRWLETPPKNRSPIVRLLDWLSR